MISGEPHDDLDEDLAGRHDEPRDEASIEFVLGEDHAGKRLDRVLSELLPERSRALIQKHISAGAVRIDGAIPKRGSKTLVRNAAKIHYTPPPVQVTPLVAEDIPLSILYEDAHIIVVDKPRGMVVHPSLSHERGTLVNALLFRVKDLGGIGGELRPGIVHRLDLGTTGAIAVAKHDRAHAALSLAFRERRIEKRYLAVTLGIPKPPQATIDTFYGRHPRDRKRFSSKVLDGKRAITHYTVTKTFLGAAEIDVRLETGRTHQIRVHFADRGVPLVGDAVYGKRRSARDPRTKAAIEGFDRPALHARRLSFAHPITGEALCIEAPIPDDLRQLIEALEGFLDRKER